MAELEELVEDDPLVVVPDAELLESEVSSAEESTILEDELGIEELELIELEESMELELEDDAILLNTLLSILELPRSVGTGSEEPARYNSRIPFTVFTYTLLGLFQFLLGFPWER